MVSLKSPITRYGGKYFLRHWIAQKIPEHVVYCEVFAGAGHLLFTKPPARVEIINDIDGHLINFFKVIQHPEARQALINRLNHMPYSRALWQELRKQWKQNDIPTDSVEAATKWFYLNRTCFSGDMARGGFATASVTGRNPSQSFSTAIDSIEAVAQRLRGVTVENLGYEACIQKYDSPNTLFFCDPPYLNTEFYYDGKFIHKDHYNLARLLPGVKAKAMLTHYENDLYEELYRGWYRHKYTTFKGSHKAEENTKKPRVTEILYTNYKTHETLFEGT